MVSHTNTNTMRKRIQAIPKFPFGMNFSQAWYGYTGNRVRAAGRGVLSKAERTLFPNSPDGKGMSATAISSNAYGRQPPHQPMATVTTMPSPGCGKKGRTIHWDEQRCLSILEARRGQGFPDAEVLLGSKATQYKLVGNSVAREVSLALGVVVTQAVMRSSMQNFQDLVVESVEEEGGRRRRPPRSQRSRHFGRRRRGQGRLRPRRCRDLERPQEQASRRARQRRRHGPARKENGSRRRHGWRAGGLEGWRMKNRKLGTKLTCAC